jgi:hypothetical protein
MGCDSAERLLGEIERFTSVEDEGHVLLVVGREGAIFTHRWVASLHTHAVVEVRSDFQAERVTVVHLRATNMRK